MTDHRAELQRRARRKLARVRVLYFSKGQPRAVDAECQNISIDGLFIKTRRPGPGQGTPVSLIVYLDAEQEVMLNGIIRWQGEMRSLEGRGELEAGMGIQFTDVDDGTRASLEARLRQLPDA